MLETMKTFWDIETEKTWRINVLFIILVILYFVPIYVVWIIAKMIFSMRQNLFSQEHSFSFFGVDTLIILLIAGIASILHWDYSNRNVVSKVLTLLGALPPDKNDKYHYMFQNVVDEITTAAGSIQVERWIVPTGAMNAFALADMRGRNVVGVTEGLLSRLSREELQGVMAHEIAHIVSLDCLQTTTICSLFGIYSETLARLNKAAVSSKPMLVQYLDNEPPRPIAAYAVASFPLLLLLFITDLLGLFLNMFISREKEYRADASAVKYSRNPIALARALYRIATHWRGAGYGGEYLAPIFILRPEFNQLDEKESAIATLFSTHPPLLRRLQLLLDMAHANFDEVQSVLKKEHRIKTEQDVLKPQAGYLALHDQKWRGPFTLLQLKTKDWLQPDTRLRLSDSETTIRAGDIPELNILFQRRDEPIWKLRRLCPDCHEWLIPQGYEGLYVWRCAYCDGMMVEVKKLPRIFVRHDRGFSERIQRIAQLKLTEAQKKKPRFNIMLGTAHPRCCPKCGKNMMHKFFSYAYHVEIDECQRCGVLWFDRDELEILQCLIEMGELPANSKH